MDFLDLRDAMTNHRPVVSRFDRQPNRFLEAVFIQDRAHIEVVGHD